MNSLLESQRRTGASTTQQWDYTESACYVLQKTGKKKTHKILKKKKFLLIDSEWLTVIKKGHNLFQIEMPV